MDEMLKISNVNKIYKVNKNENFQALHNISVSFSSGELVSIVGESGSGKSTLMNLIGGLDSDFTGDIIVNGENLRKLTDKELDKYRKDKVGFVFQSFNLISHLSILDNVTLALTLSNVSEKEKVERATNILKLVGLESQLKKKPTQLSGGQKQRVAIARALINNPDIIIADEPTGSLDTSTTMQILKILKEIADSGKLVIMVTHSEKVASVSSRVVEIADGRIVSDHKNENYKKDSAKTFKEVKKKEKKLKQNLSYWSAIKLSFHNMWASKTKNFLMAFGVAIGIGSLLLMMCFSSGITDFITSTMKSYSDPTIVTVSKSMDYGDILTGGGIEIPLFDAEGEEIGQIVEGINAYLTENGFDESELITDKNLSPGFNMMTFPGILTAHIEYDLDGDGIISDEEKLSITYLYTTPPYYTETNLVEGEMSTSEGGIMLTPAIYNFFGEENPVGKSVKVVINFDGTEFTIGNEIDSTESKITGIMDTSVFSSMPIIYIDYDFFMSKFTEYSKKPAQPTTYYIKTQSEEVSSAINRYISTLEGYTGSIEEGLASMFQSMADTIGTSLVILSAISLLVSAIMILVVMYMSVSERTKEIGVLKSIGARKKDIHRIFSSESFLVGLLSGLCGLAVAGFLMLVIYIILINLVGIAPLSFRWYYPFIALGVSVVISILSGLYPASKAARLDPVESLRRE